MKHARTVIILFVSLLLIYAATNYGGIRSSDSEIVFRVAESLESRGAMEVRDELPWEGFGLADGVDGKRYAVFGPGESVIAVPLIRFARWLNRTGWYDTAGIYLPPSHYLTNGFQAEYTGEPLEDRPAHALRCIVSYFNAIVTALSVVVFYAVLTRLTTRPIVPLVVALLYGLGSLAWPYAGTFFSEPLATLFVLSSFLLLVHNDHQAPAGRPAPSRRQLVLAGLFLGVAATVHITAILFLPFFTVYAISLFWGRANKIYAAGNGATLFLSGAVVMLGLLAWYNYARFGSVLETGRTVCPDSHERFGYGVTVAPWRGLYGLTLSPGKGIALYCPLIIVGLIGWRRFHKRHRLLSWVLILAACSRILFLASRSDWHGGYCLGPRYLMMLIPFLLIPIASWLETILHQRRRGALTLLSITAFISIAQQMYFSLGEVFHFYCTIRAQFREIGIDILDNDRMYLDWLASPLTRLLSLPQAPQAVRQLGLNNFALWLLALLPLAVAVSRFKRVLLQCMPPQQEEPLTDSAPPPDPSFGSTRVRNITQPSHGGEWVSTPPAECN